jgi:hypothetical protein
MLTRSVVPLTRSRTNTPPIGFFSPATKFDADDTKATKRPSALITPCELVPFAGISALPEIASAELSPCRRPADCPPAGGTSPVAATTPVAEQTRSSAQARERRITIHSR